MPWDRFFVLQELDAQIDLLREELLLASRVGDGSTTHLELDIARARRDEAATQAQLAARARERKEAAASLPALFLGHYDRIRKRLKSRPWVVRLHGPVCPACNMLLPSQLASVAQRTSEPVICPSCTRLLIWRSAEPAR